MNCVATVGCEPCGEDAGVLKDEAILDIGRWLDSLPVADHVDDLPSIARRAWHDLKESPTEMGAQAASAGIDSGAISPTTIGRLRAKWQIAELERDRQGQFLKIEDLKQEMEKLQKRERDLTGDLDKSQVALNGQWKDFATARKNALNDNHLASLKTIVIPRLQDDVSDLAGRLRKAVEYVRKFQEALKRFREMVETVKAAKRMVESGYEKVVAAVDAAKAIPTTISGTLSGAITDPGKFLISAADSLAKQAEGIYRGDFDAAALENQINDAESKAHAFLKTAEDLAQDLDNKKAKLAEASMETATLERFKPGGDVL